MNKIRPWLAIFIALAIAAFGGAINLIGIISSPLQAFAIALILISSAGLVIMSYFELYKIETIENEKELKRQHKSDKVQEEILETQRAILETQKRLLDFLQQNEDTTHNTNSQLAFPDEQDDDNSENMQSKS